MKPTQNDPALLDELLSLEHHQPADAALRGALLSQTSRLLRRRVLVRRATLTAALAGFYLAGLATAALYFSTDSLSAENVAQQQIDNNQSSNPQQTVNNHRQRDPAADQVDKNPAAGSFANQRNHTKPVKTHRATVQLTRFESLCALGDQYLNRRHNPEAATRCYQMALRHATLQEQEKAATGGTWLFRALYQDIPLTQPTEQDHETDPSQS